MSAAPFGFTHILPVHWEVGADDPFSTCQTTILLKKIEALACRFRISRFDLTAEGEDEDKFNGWRKDGKNLVELWRGFWPYIPSDLRHSNINPSGISLYSQRA